ncbi:MAG: Smr/MutS family protein [Bacteroidota bacterium]
MYFPANFEQKLGFDAIRQHLRNRCLSSLGRALVEKLGFSTDAGEIHQWLTETNELKQIIQFEENFPSQDYYDMIAELLRIRLPGTFMETDQLSELKLSVTTIASLISFFNSRKEKFPMLSAKTSVENSSFFFSIAKQIESIIDEKSEVRDSASAELHRIRKEKASLIGSVERQIIQHFKKAKQNGWTPDDAEVTIRYGRLVIPMINTHKRRVSGFIHDESATGHTVYLEPTEIFETNNEIRELEYAERREIVRILMAFAAEIRPDIERLVHGYYLLGQIDFIRAKAMFAIEINAENPIHHPQQDTLPEQYGFIWHNAIHPLLFLSHQKQKKSVIPLDIALNQNQRILIISGPNAGGKSVCLKTTGLVQYMFQCGLLPPVREDSEFCIFTKIFIDIGDEQSIDNDLSTYSSKLLNLKFFLENIDDRTLFLIDEFGTGTDPSLGGAIAEASLEAMNQRKAMGVVTTHYSNLKLLAGREQGIVNGAMLFDLKKLKPLYQLKTGYPGSSFALEIAQEIGFPELVLKNAKTKTGKSQLDFDRELQTLEVEKQEINKQKNEIEVADDFLAELISKYQKLNGDLEAKKREIIEKARVEAREILDNANKTIEKTIREIRESQAEKNRTKEIRAELSTVKEKLQKEIAAAPAVQPLAPQSVAVGSASAPNRFNQYVNELNTKLNNYKLTLDIRGQRAEEALALLQRYTDDAVMFSISEVHILHGKGNGILRQITRDYLRSLKEVKSVRDAPLEQGGSGITIVNFK